ncbi:glycosyltransferase [Candidatus Saccharibacteria bacterium]|nr:glycosyltransferase [Candidatus Saccharibacteria bacterium]
MKKFRVNIVSESDFTLQGHGVHTAYLEMRDSLESLPKVELLANARPQSNADITHIHTVGSFSFRRLISRHGGKKVVSAHIVPDSLVGSIVGARWWLPFFKPYLRWFYNRADLVIAVSPYTRDELKKMGVRSQIEILENSIDTSKYQTSRAQKSRFREELKLPVDKFIVVGNGQIQPRKKFDTFVAIAKKMPEIQFVWIGGIPFKAAGADFLNLNKMMKSPPKNLRVTNVIPLNQAGRYMRAADAMFMPSAQETFGLAVVEGAASGLPIVVRDIHDYDATFGDLVLRGNENTFVDSIKRLKNDQKFYEKWRANSAKLAEKYDSKEMTEKLVGFYHDILKK